MVQVNPKQLISKLNDTCRRSLEGAVGLCLSRTNYNVEIEHWFLKLLETPNTDLQVILQHYGVESSRLIADLNKEVDKFKSGNARPPALSPTLVDLARESWIICSIDQSQRQSRSGHMLIALLGDEALSRTAAATSDEFSKILVSDLRANIDQITADSIEAGQPATDSDAGDRPAPW